MLRRNLLLGLCALAAWSSCSRAPTLLVSVENIPVGVQSLSVIATHDGLAAIEDLEPYALPNPASAAQTNTLLLRLPTAFTGDLGINVAAFKDPGAAGCLLATGTTNIAMFNGPDETARVILSPVPEGACSTKRPMLVSASPSLGKTAGGDSVTIQGWGFKPGATVNIGSKPVTNVSFVSASELKVTTPAQAGFGLVDIKVTNRDGANDLRKDLFRLYTDTLSLTAYPIGSGAAYMDPGLIASGKFDPATTIDVALAIRASNRIRVLFTKDRVPLDAKQKEYDVGMAPSGVVTGDLDKDGDLDLAVASAGSNTVQLLLNDGSGIFTVGSPIAVGMGPESLVLADLDKDGDLDIVTANKLSNNITIIRNKGDGTVDGMPQNIKVDTGPVSVAVGDIDGDKTPDIAVACQTANTVSITIKLDTAQSTTYQLPAGLSPSSVVVEDTDGNGFPEVIVSGTGSNKITIYKNLGNLNIQPFELTTEPGPRGLAYVDMNGDGFGDIVVPASGVSSIDFFLNKQGKGFEGVTYQKFGLAIGCSSPTQLVILDADEDKRPDLVVVGNGCINALFNQSN